MEAKRDWKSMSVDERMGLMRQSKKKLQAVENMKVGLATRKLLDVERHSRVTLRMDAKSVRELRLEAGGVYGMWPCRFVEALWEDYKRRGEILDIGRFRLGGERRDVAGRGVERGKKVEE